MSGDKASKIKDWKQTGIVSAQMLISCGPPVGAQLKVRLTSPLLSDFVIGSSMSCIVQKGMPLGHLSFIYSGEDIIIMRKVKWILLVQARQIAAASRTPDLGQSGSRRWNGHQQERKHTGRQEARSSFDWFWAPPPIRWDTAPPCFWYTMGPRHRSTADIRLWIHAAGCRRYEKQVARIARGSSWFAPTRHHWDSENFGRVCGTHCGLETCVRGEIEELGWGRILLRSIGCCSESSEMGPLELLPWHLGRPRRCGRWDCSLPKSPPPLHPCCCCSSMILLNPCSCEFGIRRKRVTCPPSKKNPWEPANLPQASEPHRNECVGCMMCLFYHLQSVGTEQDKEKTPIVSAQSLWEHGNAARSAPKRNQGLDILHHTPQHFCDWNRTNLMSTLTCDVLFSCNLGSDPTCNLKPGKSSQNRYSQLGFYHLWCTWWRVFGLKRTKIRRSLFPHNCSESMEMKPWQTDRRHFDEGKDILHQTRSATLPWLS